MERIKVSSSMAAAIGYDPAIKQLEIVYKAMRGFHAVWRYEGVEQADFVALLAPGASVGKLVHQLRARELQSTQMESEIEQHEVVDA
jgi:hypothetical protein